jgi:hypothetical protein
MWYCPFCKQPLGEQLRDCTCGEYAFDRWMHEQRADLMTAYLQAHPGEMQAMLQRATDLYEAEGQRCQAVYDQHVRVFDEIHQLTESYDYHRPTNEPSPLAIDAEGTLEEFPF